MVKNYLWVCVLLCVLGRIAAEGTAVEDASATRCAMDKVKAVSDSGIINKLFSNSQFKSKIIAQIKSISPIRLPAKKDLTVGPIYIDNPNYHSVALSVPTSTTARISVKGISLSIRKTSINAKKSIFFLELSAHSKRSNKVFSFMEVLSKVNGQKQAKRSRRLLSRRVEARHGKWGKVGKWVKKTIVAPVKKVVKKITTVTCKGYVWGSLSHTDITADIQFVKQGSRMVAKVLKSNINAGKIHVGYKINGVVCKIGSMFINVKDMASKKLREKLKEKKFQDNINTQLSKAISERKELQMLFGDCAGTKSPSTVNAERAEMDRMQDMKFKSEISKHRGSSSSTETCARDIFSKISQQQSSKLKQLLKKVIDTKVLQQLSGRTLPRMTKNIAHPIKGFGNINAEVKINPIKIQGLRLAHAPHILASAHTAPSVKLSGLSLSVPSTSVYATIKALGMSFRCSGKFSLSTSGTDIGSVIHEFYRSGSHVGVKTKTFVWLRNLRVTSQLSGICKLGGLFFDINKKLEDEIRNRAGPLIDEKLPEMIKGQETVQKIMAPCVQSTSLAAIENERVKAENQEKVQEQNRKREISRATPSSAEKCARNIFSTIAGQQSTKFKALLKKVIDEKVVSQIKSRSFPKIDKTVSQGPFQATFSVPSIRLSQFSLARAPHVSAGPHQATTIRLGGISATVPSTKITAKVTAFGVTFHCSGTVGLSMSDTEFVSILKFSKHGSNMKINTESNVWFRNLKITHSLNGICKLGSLFVDINKKISEVLRSKVAPMIDEKIPELTRQNTMVQSLLKPCVTHIPSDAEQENARLQQQAKQRAATSKAMHVAASSSTEKCARNIFSTVAKETSKFKGLLHGFINTEAAKALKGMSFNAPKLSPTFDVKALGKIKASIAIGTVKIQHFSVGKAPTIEAGANRVTALTVPHLSLSVPPVDVRANVNLLGMDFSCSGKFGLDVQDMDLVLSMMFEKASGPSVKLNAKSYLFWKKLSLSHELSGICKLAGLFVDVNKLLKEQLRARLPGMMDSKLSSMATKMPMFQKMFKTCVAKPMTTAEKEAQRMKEQTPLRQKEEANKLQLQRHKPTYAEQCTRKKISGMAAFLGPMISKEMNGKLNGKTFNIPKLPKIEFGPVIVKDITVDPIQIKSFSSGQPKIEASAKQPVTLRVPNVAMTVPKSTISATIHAFGMHFKCGGSFGLEAAGGTDLVTVLSFMKNGDQVAVSSKSHIWWKNLKITHELTGICRLADVFVDVNSILNKLIRTNVPSKLDDMVSKLAGGQPMLQNILKPCAKTHHSVAEEKAEALEEAKKQKEEEAQKKQEKREEEADKAADKNKAEEADKAAAKAAAKAEADKTAAEKAADEAKKAAAAKKAEEAKKAAAEKKAADEMEPDTQAKESSTEKTEEPVLKPNPKCVQISGFGAIGCASDSYFGTVAPGFSIDTVKAASDKLMMLLGMVDSMGLVPAKYQSMYKKCLPKFKADICETVMPRCSDKCQPLQTCQSACKQLKSECIPAELTSKFADVMPGGKMRGMMGAVGLTEGSPPVKLLDAWLEKISTCSSEASLSSDTGKCLSNVYAKPMCDPDNITPPKKPSTDGKDTEKDIEKKSSQFAEDAKDASSGLGETTVQTAEEAVKEADKAAEYSKKSEDGVKKSADAKAELEAAKERSEKTSDKALKKALEHTGKVLEDDKEAADVQQRIDKSKSLMAAAQAAKKAAEALREAANEKQTESNSDDKKSEELENQRMDADYRAKESLDKDERERSTKAEQDLAAEEKVVKAHSKTDRKNATAYVNEAAEAKQHAVEAFLAGRKVAKTIPSPKCVLVEGLGEFGCAANSYYGSLAIGMEIADVKKGSAKLMGLLRMVESMNMVPEKHKAMYEKCMPQFKTDICETALPRCSDTCQPFQTCKSSCKKLQDECLPAVLRSQLGVILPGGKFRGMAQMYAGVEGLKIIDAWISKHHSGCSTNVSPSEKRCLTNNYDKPLCDPNHVGDDGQNNTDLLADVENEEPKTEEPKKEEPKTEEPKKEEPKTEEPKKEEPKTEESEKKPELNAQSAETKMDEPKKQVVPEMQKSVASIAHVVASQAKLKLKDQLRKVYKKIDDETGRLSAAVKKASGEMKATREKEDSSEEKEERKAPSQPATEQQKVFGDIAHAAASTAKSKIDKELKKAYKKIDEESGRLSGSVKTAEKEIAESREVSKESKGDKKVEVQPEAAPVPQESDEKVEGKSAGETKGRKAISVLRALMKKLDKMDTKLHHVHGMMKNIHSKEPAVKNVVTDPRSGLALGEVPVAFRL